MGYTATITKTGQITIPKWVREVLGVEPGQRIVFRKTKDAVTIEREKTAEQIADEIAKIIPERARKYHMEHYAGMLAKDALAKWADSDEGKAYFEKERARTI